MKLQVLMSCMYQTDATIINKSGVQTDVLVVNQCNEDKVEEFDFTNRAGKVCHAKMIYTTERGLSRSRNMALKNATGDICLICDDDEMLETDYEQSILDAFEKVENVDMIAFRLNYSKKKFAEKPYSVSKFLAGTISSVQIAFYRCKVLEKNVWFDEKMGSGTGNGGGEEVKFLFQLISSGLTMEYQPVLIATVADGKSLWFNGYNEKYFVDRGWVSRRIYGTFWGYVYIWYSSVKHYGLYRNTFPWLKILFCYHKGFLEKR